MPYYRVVPLEASRGAAGGFRRSLQGRVFIVEGLTEAAVAATDLYYEFGRGGSLRGYRLKRPPVRWAVFEILTPLSEDELEPDPEYQDSGGGYYSVRRDLPSVTLVGVYNAETGILKYKGSGAEKLITPW